MLIPLPRYALVLQAVQDCRDSPLELPPGLEASLQDSSIVSGTFASTMPPGHGDISVSRVRRDAEEFLDLLRSEVGVGVKALNPDVQLGRLCGSHCSRADCPEITQVK